jgi:sugar transferase (PEP-CTERM/EpsH1 system associated)
MVDNRYQQIRILHVIETLDVGGAETVVANIVNNTSPDFRADVCCLMNSGPIAARIRPGVKILGLGKAKEGNDYRIPLRLSKILRNRKIDIVHSHDWGTLLETIAAATIAGTYAVHMAHGPTSHYPLTDRWGPLKRYIRRKAECLSSIKLRCAIAVSDVVRKELVEDIGIPSRKVVLIRNGIDLADAPLGNLESKRGRLSLAPDDVLLVTVGRLAEIKNYPLLLKAFASAVGRAPMLKLAIVGDGPQRSKLETYTARYGLSDRVYFLGERKDVRDWLALGHAFVLPSFYEGISIALLEAMAAGLPAVATRVGGNPEIVINGVNGYLVDSGSVEGLASALVDLAHAGTRRNLMGRAARERIEAEFDLKKVISRYEKIYLEVLGRVRN